MGASIVYWVEMKTGDHWDLLHECPGSGEKFNNFSLELLDVAEDGIPDGMSEGDALSEMRAVAAYDPRECGHASLRDAAKAYRKAAAKQGFGRLCHFSYGQDEMVSLEGADVRRSDDPSELEPDDYVRYVFGLGGNVDIDSCRFLFCIG